MCVESSLVQTTLTLDCLPLKVTLDCLELIF